LGAPGGRPRRRLVPRCGQRLFTDMWAGWTSSAATANGSEAPACCDKVNSLCASVFRHGVVAACRPAGDSPGGGVLFLDRPGPRSWIRDGSLDLPPLARVGVDAPLGVGPSATLDGGVTRRSRLNDGHHAASPGISGNPTEVLPELPTRTVDSINEGWPTFTRRRQGICRCRRERPTKRRRCDT
jgi:hypothetical protein